MTVRYVGSGGNDANSGLTWALRKLTLNGAEDTPVVAGDTIYVAPGVYRETLTLDVAGTAGNIITYIGDVDGSHTDGVGGIVRITGSDNDQTATRAYCIDNSGARDYRTFQGFYFDTTTSFEYRTSGGCDYNTIQDCIFMPCTASNIAFNGAADLTNNLVQRCVFFTHRNQSSIIWSHSTQVNNSANLIQNCLFIGGANNISITRMGGITVKNCTFVGQGSSGTSSGAIVNITALTGGQTITVNNCIFQNCNQPFCGQTTADITENYNSLFGSITDRTNTNTGANSVTYPALFDARWFFELVSGKGKMLSPFDLASYSQLVNLAGTSPSTTDMRGTAVIGAEREWGALEFDSTLLVRRVIARQT